MESPGNGSRFSFNVNLTCFGITTLELVYTGEKKLHMKKLLHESKHCGPFQ